MPNLSNLSPVTEVMAGDPKSERSTPNWPWIHELYMRGVPGPEIRARHEATWGTPLSAGQLDMHAHRFGWSQARRDRLAWEAKQSKGDSGSKPNDVRRSKKKAEESTPGEPETGGKAAVTVVGPGRFDAEIGPAAAPSELLPAVATEAERVRHALDARDLASLDRAERPATALMEVIDDTLARARAGDGEERLTPAQIRDLATAVERLGALIERLTARRRGILRLDSEAARDGGGSVTQIQIAVIPASSPSQGNASRPALGSPEAPGSGGCGDI